MSAGKSKRPSAAQWFGRADEFWAAADIFGRMGERGPVIPNVVCRAFSAEAYLKCLLTIRQKQFPNDHDLHLLFGFLPLNDKRQIEENWNAVCLPLIQRARAGAPRDFNLDLIPNTLNQALKLSANAFKDWRYYVDGGKSFMLNTFPLHVRNAIIQAQPDWKVDPPDSYGQQSKDRARRTSKARAQAETQGSGSPWQVFPGRPE